MAGVSEGLLEVKLNRRNDTFIWNGSKTFSIRSMYNDIMTRGSSF
jgi:hypothetical protein